MGKKIKPIKWDGFRGTMGRQDIKLNYMQARFAAAALRVEIDRIKARGYSAAGQIDVLKALEKQIEPIDQLLNEQARKYEE